MPPGLEPGAPVWGGGSPGGLEPPLGGPVVPGGVGGVPGGLSPEGGLTPSGGGEVPSGGAGDTPGGVRPGRALGLRIGSCGMICRSPGLTGGGVGWLPVAGRGAGCGVVAAVINSQRGR